MEYLDNKIKDNLKYLDKILEINLSKGTNYKIDVKTLAENINPIDISSFFSESWKDKIKGFFVKPKPLWELFGEQELNLDDASQFNSEESKFVNALLYLHNEGYIIFAQYPINTSLLLFKGMIKISSGGFYKEYTRQKKRDLYQNYAWVVAVLTFMAGWILKPLLKIVQEYFK